MSKRYWGITLSSLSIFLILLYLIPGYHTFYWAHPIIFISLTIIGVISALFGSYWFRASIRKGSERKELLYKLLVLLGGLVFLIAICAGYFAILGSFFIGLGTGYWGDSFSGFSDYGGDSRVLALQILLFSLSVLSSFIGQFIISFGYNKS